MPGDAGRRGQRVLPRLRLDGMPTLDDVLAAELSAARGFRRVEIAVALGYSEGGPGPTHLRVLLRETGPGTSDLRCAALLALAKRCREEAHDDYVRAYQSTDAGTRDYAMLALSAYGRDGLWEEVADRLVTTVRRRHRRGTTPSEVVVMIVYLARHSAAHTNGSQRWSRVSGSTGKRSTRTVETRRSSGSPRTGPTSRPTARPDEVSARWRGHASLDPAEPIVRPSELTRQPSGGSGARGVGRSRETSRVPCGRGGTGSRGGWTTGRCRGR